MFLVYLEAIELQPTMLNLGNVFDSGSQDTRVRAAKERAAALFKEHGGYEEGKDKIKREWNGRDTPTAQKICTTFNLPGDKIKQRTT